MRAIEIIAENEADFNAQIDMTFNEMSDVTIGLLHSFAYNNGETTAVAEIEATIDREIETDPLKPDEMVIEITNLLDQFNLNGTANEFNENAVSAYDASNAKVVPFPSINIDSLVNKFSKISIIRESEGVVGIELVQNDSCKTTIWFTEQMWLHFSQIMGNNKWVMPVQTTSNRLFVEYPNHTVSEEHFDSTSGDTSIEYDSSIDDSSDDSWPEEVFSPETLKLKMIKLFENDRVRRNLSG